MGLENETFDPKSQLAIEICNISITCSHKPPFVDWYLVLQIEENADLKVMRKQYRKLALQLHPDKNKHPKAEIAFKFLSEFLSIDIWDKINKRIMQCNGGQFNNQIPVKKMLSSKKQQSTGSIAQWANILAYSCLSNNARRAEFNLERKNSKCLECNRNKHSINGPFPADRLLNSPKFVQNLGDLRARLSAESKVIENCLKVISESKRGKSSKIDYPVFNPVDYLSQGYPHRRTTIYKNSENFLCLWKTNVPNL